MGPDGGVVVATSTGDVYSLTADGALRWHVPSVATDGGPSVGSDGSVYVAAMHKVTAIAPDGSIRWTFTEPAASGQGVIAGPSVGPDGNIYAISDLGGIGAFALSPSGQPLWSNPGSPAFAENGQLGVQIVFGSGRLFAAFDEVGTAPSAMFGLALSGAPQWAKPHGGTDDQFMQQQRQPATGPDGSLYLTGMGGANGWSLYRIDPATGNVLWSRSPAPSNGMSAPRVGPHGSVYYARSLSYLDSVTSACQVRWTFSDSSIIDNPAVSPNGGVVVAGAGRTSVSPERSRSGTRQPASSPRSSACPMKMAATRSCTRRHDSPPTAAPPTSAPRSSAAPGGRPTSTRSTPTPAAPPLRASPSCPPSSAKRKPQPRQTSSPPTSQ